MIELGKYSIEVNLGLFIDKLFLLPEVVCVKIKSLEIYRENKEEMIKPAVNGSYHDVFSDIDLCVIVKLPKGDGITPDAYLRHIEHWGFPLETILGVCFEPEDYLCRMVCRNGMRYDVKFEFMVQENPDEIELKPVRQESSNVNWPIENIYRFWFVQIQALGKLYRDDFLISSHLANINLNETLVQQMILRDLRYNTNHHRYGYKEELTYLKYMAQCPRKSGNLVFDDIAGRIYGAALAYDELTTFFYQDYEPRSKYFFAIWKCYAENHCGHIVSGN